MVRPSDEELSSAAFALNGKSPQAILRWAVAEFHPHLLMATAFGAEGCCLLHMLAEIEPGVTVINLDTGYQFQENVAEKIERSGSRVWWQERQAPCACTAGAVRVPMVPSSTVRRLRSLMCAPSQKRFFEYSVAAPREEMQ
jgi:hypothetical protein